MGLISNLFSGKGWRSTKEQQNQSNPMVGRTNRPNPIDMTEQWTVDDAFALGIYYGTQPGLKLASAVAFPIVAVPIAFMGIPTPTANAPVTQKLLEEVTPGASKLLSKAYTLSRIVGTAWAWPNWDARRGRIYHELIPNASIVDIIRHVDTGEIIQIITDEQITIQTGENQQSIVHRKRYFTPQTVRVEWTGDVPAGLVNKTTRNPSGIMPINFPNDVLDNSSRGVSVYSRLISHLKSYHDTDVRWTEDLTMFRTKQVQTIKGSVDDWLAQNGVDADFDVATTTLILNKEGESTAYEFPGDGMTTAYKERQSASFYNLVEGSGVSEIVFGLSMTGNNASAESEMTKLANTVQGMRTQANDPSRAYYEACLRLQAGASMASGDHEFEMPWNDLDVVGQEVKAKILEAQSRALNLLEDKSTIPLETKHQFLLTLFPKMTEPKFETWKAQMDAAAKFKQFQSASYTEALDAKGAME